MQIQVNGEVQETAATTVAQLLREMQLPQQGIAVAVNEAVVRRHDHETHQLQPGDQVEIIRAVQGG